jgi:hypothetical protein
LDDLAENIGEGFKKVEASTEASISRTQNSWQGMIDRMDNEGSKVLEEHFKKVSAMGNRTDDLQAKLEKVYYGFHALFYIPMTMMGIV